MHHDSKIGAQKNWNRIMELTACLAALFAAALGLAILLEWIFKLPILSTLGTDQVPMSPSSAILFLLFGLLVFARAKHIKGSIAWNMSRTLTLTGLLIAFALFIAGFIGIQAKLEQPGINISEAVVRFPAEQMSPLTALCFLVAGISLLLMLYSNGNPDYRAKISFLCSFLLLIVSIILITFYLLGASLLYRSGIIPPALTTSIAFLMLATGLFIPAARWISLSPEDSPHEHFGRWGALVLLSVFSAMIIVTLAYFYFNHYEVRFRAEVGKDLSAIAELKSHELVRWREERLGDASVFYQNESFSKLVNQYLADPDEPSLRKELGVWLGHLRKAYQYDRVSILDTSGRERLSYPAESEQVQPHESQELEAVLKAGVIQFLDFHLHTTNGKPYLGVIVPIQGSGRQGEWTGGLLMRIDPELYLYPMLMNWPTPSETGETLLVRREGEEVMFLNPLLFNESAALRFRIPLSRVDLPAAQAILGHEGIVEGNDYRGIPALAAIRAVPDSPWFLVARMDLNEVYGPLRERMWWTVMLVSILFVLLAAIMSVVWQRNIKAHYRKLHQAESIYGTTLKSIGDGVIVTDSEGRVELLNQVAEELTGWKIDQAARKSFDEVFSIINENSREPVINPVKKVLKKGTIVGLSNHTLLISRDGREIPISDTGAPIRDQEGNITGVVLVFSDKTREREAEKQLKEREAKYRGLFNSIRDAILVTDMNWKIVDCNPAFTEMFECGLQDIVGEQPEIICENLEEFRSVGEQIRTSFEGEEFLFTINYKTLTGRIFPGETKIFKLLRSGGEAIGLIGIIHDISDRRIQQKKQELLQAQLSQAQKMESVGKLAGGVAHDFNNMLSVIIGNVELVMDRIDDSDPLCSDLEGIRQAAVRSADLTRQLLAFARKQTISPRMLDFNEVLQGMLNMLQRLIGEDIEINWNPGEDLWPVKMDPAQLDQILANLCVNARDAISGVGKLTIETQNVEVDSDYCDNHQDFIPGEFVTLSVSDNGSGMVPEIMQHLFEPFFTTKDIGVGTGLGLAMVYGIVKQNDGFINVYSEPGHGTTFRIYLPRYSGPEYSSVAKESAEISLGGAETVLIVEDEGTLLKMGRMMLEKLGYTVLTAGTPGEALRLVRESDGKIDLLITDVVMPEMNGLELSRQITIIRPDVKTLFMSGYTANVIAHHGVLDEGVHFLEKPFSLRTLSICVRNALDA